MAAVIKRDINKKRVEESEFPSVCETCLGPNPYIRMLKQQSGAECKICSRPFTVFRWPIKGQSKYQKTALCNSCCRTRNCCALCMLDLQFGLPIQIRDAALKLVQQGPTSNMNREYHAQNQKEKNDVTRASADHGKAESAARELLRKLARSGPYARKPIEQGDEASQAASISSKAQRTTPSNGEAVTSLFLSNIETDISETSIRQHFAQFGTIKSVSYSTKSQCAFVNFETRIAAENAALQCAGETLIRGCPVKVQWGKARPASSA